ncbi:sulfide/dihydroorotate dehydrogenase-like FAD/NAD-binding protein [Candidatus Sumerlaeota bacterium]|nr:sulfide/dihydroorotate dehydrogenase-like FAD/NAD-binding protein [Candidatus Sumerlaeota bacterium]
MNDVLETTWLSPQVKWFRIESPDISRKARAGQFVIVRVEEQGERIPLTIADFDGINTIDFVVQEVGAGTRAINRLQKGDRFLNIAGPLGRPSEIDRFGVVVCIGGGIGIAPLYPIAKELRKSGNTILSILGARNKDLLFWLDKFSALSDELVIITDDGSMGRKGVVTEPLKELIAKNMKIDRVIAIGPAVMMKFVSIVTKEKSIKTIVSLNPIMLDGTGMCGGCRVEVAGVSKFVCVDGPEFDAHQVDFDLLMARQGIYKNEEQECRIRGVLQ